MSPILLYAVHKILIGRWYSEIACHSIWWLLVISWIKIFRLNLIFEVPIHASKLMWLSIADKSWSAFGMITDRQKRKTKKLLGVQEILRYKDFAKIIGMLSTFYAFSGMKIQTFSNLVREHIYVTSLKVYYVSSSLNLPPTAFVWCLLGTDNEQLICICHAALNYPALSHSLPQMSFPGWQALAYLAVSCLNPSLSLWSSLLLFSKSFSIPSHVLWEEGSDLHSRRGQTLCAAAGWPVDTEYTRWHLTLVQSPENSLVTLLVVKVTLQP